MPRVSEIYSYPIKSCAGTSLESAQITEYGVEHDREFMVVDQDGSHLSQREIPQLALVKPHIGHNFMRVIAPDMEELVINTADTDYPPIDTTVHKSYAPAIKQSHEADEWFSEYLKKAVHVVRKDPLNDRSVASHRQVEDGTNKVAFADGAPILLTSTASLAELNERSSQLIAMNRFRPNIVVSGGDNGLQPFDEDYWRDLLIRNVKLAVAWPSPRCVMINNDQTTAVNSGRVLATLGRFRKGRDPRSSENKPGIFFGQNVIPRSIGKIAVGDEVHVRRRADEPNFMLDD